MARRKWFVGLALDVASLVLALEAASLVVFRHPVPWLARPGSGVMLGAMVGGSVIGLYLGHRTAGTGIRRPSYGRALTMPLIMLAVTATVLVFSRAYWSRAYVLTTTVSWFTLAIGHRVIRRRRPWTEAMVLVTSEKVLVEHLLDAPHASVTLVLDPVGRPPDGPLPLGTVIAVDLRSVLSDEMARFVSSCNLAGYEIRSLVATYEEHTGRLPIVHLMEGWELTVPLSGRGPYVKTKRIVDTVLVLLTAPISIVLGALITIAIKIDSRGPVIFSQRRIGREGKPFTLYKFRTMRHEPEGTARFAAREDDRLTRVGRVLRHMRIDELPQLWNVLRGDLSLVGPRPEQGPFVERFSATIPFYTHRHLVRPGITGWAQVNFGYADNEADTVEKLSYDLYYIKHVSPWFDMEVLGRSVWTVLSGFGAR
jgi:lipopolysaccharide/colanic/teichoic acid biosynthesis glycosyltransferase